MKINHPIPGKTLAELDEDMRQIKAHADLMLKAQMNALTALEKSLNDDARKVVLALCSFMTAIVVVAVGLDWVKILASFFK